MLNRLTLLIAAAFWALMTVLLWRSEFGANHGAGSPVPVRLIWEKILTAPDASALQITHRGTNIGFCRWTASQGRDVLAALSAREEGAVENFDQPTSYTLDLDGNVNLADFGTRVGLDLSLKLDSREDWEEFRARLKLRPDLYEVEALAAEKTVRVRSNAGGGRYDRTFKFSELQNPQKLLREAGGPLLPGLLTTLGVPLSTNAMSRFSLGLNWRARQDWLQAGRTRMRVYRLETRLLDRYRIRIAVSPAGEILQVELPDKVLLRHETLGNFPAAL
jgi:hypothetical protein